MHNSWLIMVVAGLALSACAREPEPTSAEAAAPAEAAVATVGNVAAETVRTDPDSGLIIDQHWELVKAHCSACHSPALVTQNRGTRQNWLEMIRWMQATQGLWAFDEQTENSILDYLAANYAPAAGYRRAPLPKALMPENPYTGGKK